LQGDGSGRNVVRKLLWGILALVAAQTGWGADKPCELKAASAMRVIVDEDGTVLVPVRIGERAGFMILQLNTGFPILIPNYLEELGLKKSMRSVDRDITAGGRRIKQRVHVKSTMIGQAYFADWDYLVSPVVPAQPPQFQGYPVFGTLSSWFMNGVDLELDLGAGRINLFLPNDCQGSPVYWGGEVTEVPLFVDRSGLLLFPVEVEGTKFEASLNTTTSMSTITSESVQQYLGFDENSPGVEHQKLPNGTEIASFRAMSLTAKGLNVRNARVRLRPNKSCKPSTGSRESGAIGCRDTWGFTPFSIGTNLMKRLRIFVSLRDKKIYFTRVEPAAAAATTVPDGANSAPNAAQ
jgi:hypothetical protein